MTPIMGVVIVTYNSAEVICDCLESLMASQGVRLRILVVDNASSDGTVQRLRDWADGRWPYKAPADAPLALPPCAKPLPLHAGSSAAQVGHSIAVLETGVNGGFAFGVNRGLEVLAAEAEITRFWILNPDCIALPGTARRFARAKGPEEGFSLMGGRVVYWEDPEKIQSDGGTINWRTGVTDNIHQYAGLDRPPPPSAGEGAPDFISGANMVASRAFYEKAGPLREDYFLYYEEADWALRRGKLPLSYVRGALVFHRAGASIGSGSVARAPTPFATYFLYRARFRFLRRFGRRSLVWAYLWAFAKALQMWTNEERPQARALWRGIWDAPPPDEVRARLAPEAAARAFAPLNPAPAPGAARPSSA